jgi:glycosyltransferase involved in cell wall biosynthesis
MDISILLPTRGRTETLDRCLTSLIDNCESRSSLEILLAFDDDDQESSQYFLDTIAPRIDRAGAKFTCFTFPRLGYIRLNEYVNYLASQAKGRWLVFWGDDAVMQTPGWDQRILEVKDFRVLRIPTHNQHPYAIFPIVPRGWYELFGYISAHQLSDSWVSQIAYMIDIMQDIDVGVVHDRFDITGNNGDDTFANRPMLEGRPHDPRDFNHESWRGRRLSDASRLADHLRSLGQDMSWFDRVRTGQQDPWAKMCGPECDPNKQVVCWPTNN